MKFQHVTLKSGASLYAYLPGDEYFVSTPTRAAVLAFPETDDPSKIEEDGVFFAAAGYQYFALPLPPTSDEKLALSRAVEAIDFIRPYSSQYHIDTGCLNVYASGSNAIYALAMGTDTSWGIASMILREPVLPETGFPENKLGPRTAPLFYSQTHPTHRDLAFGKALVEYHILASFHLSEEVPDAEGVLNWLYRIRKQQGKTISNW